MKKPHKYTGQFQYAGQEVSFSFWACANGDEPPDTILFLGAGQIGSIPRWVSMAAGAGVVVVDGLPHWKAHPSGKDIAQFSAIYIQAVFKIVLSTFNLTRMNILAESQAAPASVMLSAHLPGMVRNIALIRPLGFTVQAFGDSERARLRTFRRRIFRTSLQFSQSLLHDPRNVAITLAMLGAIVREPSLTSFNTKYAVGVSYDLLEDCRQVAGAQQRKGHSFTLLLGEKDKLFSPIEIQAALTVAGIDGVKVKTMPGVGHASLAVRASRGILQQAIQTVRKHTDSLPLP